MGDKSPGCGCGLGAGGVFLGRSPGGRSVAIKVAHGSPVHQPEFRSRLRSEVQALRAVVLRAAVAGLRDLLKAP